MASFFRESTNRDLLFARPWLHISGVFVLNARVPHGKSALNINMDETGIRLFQAAGVGNMVVEAARLRGHGLRPVQTMNKHQERSNLGHVVMVCDDPAVTSAAAGNYLQQTHVASTGK